MNFNLDGTNALDKTTTEDNSFKYSSLESDNYLNIGYKSYRNSEHLQNEQEFRIGVNPSFSNRKNDGDITYKNTVIGTYYNLTSRNRIYYQNQFFFEPDFVLIGSLKERKEDDKSQFSLLKTRDNAMQISVPLLVGHGRIEQIQDARLAIYILEELQKAGRISKMPTNEDILEFSRLISGLKNERFFDYRLRKMIEMEKVDSFLQAKEFISSPDVRYYTIVDDNWEYAQGPVRESGNRLSAGLVPEFRYYYSDEETTYTSPDDTSEQKNTRKTAGIKLQTMYESEKPLNLHWQRSMSATLSYGYSKNLNTNQLSENPERKSDTDELTLEAAFDYGMGYFPNSRTDITGLFSLDLQQFNKKENLDEPLEQLKGYRIDPPDFLRTELLHFTPIQVKP